MQIVLDNCTEIVQCGRVRHAIAEIPAGEAGTDATVRKIAELIEQSLLRPRVRLTAIKILDHAGVQNKNQKQAAHALYRWVRRHIRYVPDPINVETVQSPEATLTIKAGDCDDHSGLVAGLALSIGIPARFKVVGPSTDHFAHIYPELFLNGQWTTADTTAKTPFGKPVGNFKAEKTYDYKGAPTMLGAPVQTIPLDRGYLAQLSYEAALDVLKTNWAQGRINRTDVNGYLRVIDEGNSPARGTFAEPAMRKAISDFLDLVNGTGERSSKPEGTLNGLEGLDGFFKSIWKGVKSVVGGAVKLAIGGGGNQQPQTQTIVVRETRKEPAQSAPVQASSFSFGNPTTMMMVAAAGIGAIMLLKNR